jgi:hypothetical protein
MENFIRQAFKHVEGLESQVNAGNYDLLGPDDQIILPRDWDRVVEPGMKIAMYMWPPPPAQNTPEKTRLRKEHRKKGSFSMMAAVAKYLTYF